jgi:two-component system phosphate regulon sensor histidine kinase PhoR
MRNHLAVAVANIEAFIDGQLEPTHNRLNAVLQALHELDYLLGDLTPDEPAAMHSDLRSIDVCRLIANEATLMEATARERGVDFRVHRCDEVHPACGSFLGDPVRIGQIVTNVMSNAIRYTPRGGAIEVDCHRGRGDLVFTVSDQGPGVEPAEMSRIFESGFRGSAAGATDGSGIGLSLVKSFIEEHGGSIDVRSSAGGGATFTVRLPGHLQALADCDHCLQAGHAQTRTAGISPQ